MMNVHITAATLVCGLKAEIGGQRVRTAVVPRNLITFVIGLLAFYGILVVFAYLAQERMLYFPSRATRRQTVESAAQWGLVLWPEGAGDYYGLVSMTPPDAHRGTVLVWHGNAGSAVHRAHYVQALHGLGFRVVVIEYPGYGARSGEVGEASFVRDALRAAYLAQEEFGGPLYVWGESLGCGVASAVAAAAVAADPELDVRGAVMLTPWDSLPRLAQRLYWYLPARWLVRDRYDNVRNLAGFGGPVAVLMAARDEVIPNEHTVRLYDSLPGEKRLWVFDHAGHNSWPASPDAGWWAEVMEYVGQPPS
jgi:pimeloyl-ACP methyl ester carboxylesterase